MLRRFGWVGVGLLICVVGVGAYLRWSGPPRIVRLLPECDAVVYLNVAPVRAATHFDRKPVVAAPAYQQFIDATGIRPERDLDEAAFALTRMSDANGPNGRVAYSEVFRGRFDKGRLTRWLASSASSEEVYAAHTVYSLPSDGRTLRVAVLSEDRVAVSNAPTPEQMHSILDRSGAGGWFGGAASVVTDLYGNVPALSLAWGIGHLALPFAEDGRLAVAGLQLPLAADSTFVASVRYRTALELRVDELTVSQADADQTAQGLNNLLSLVRSFEKDPGIRGVLDSIVIEPRKDRATLSATVPVEVLRQVTAGQP